MSEVPVKIAESYKPPKKVILNQNIVQRLSNLSNATNQCLANCAYDFSLEHSVLAQMTHWQNVRQRNDDERKKRLCSYQQQQQKQFEANQKQMITAVSYPSTDDLSSDDDDGDSGHGTSSDSKPPSATKIPIANATTQQPNQFQFSPPNRFDSILVPTVMAERHANQPDNGNVTKTKTPLHSKFNFHEFENYSSNPFDNVELKTINDLDILAEVWNSSVSISRQATDTKQSQVTEVVTPTPPECNQQQQQQPNNLHTNFTPTESYNANQMYHQTSNVTNMHSDLRQTPTFNHSTTSRIETVATQMNDYYGNHMNFNYQAGGAMAATTYPSNQPMHTVPINNNTSYGHGHVQNPYGGTYYGAMKSDGNHIQSYETTDSMYNNESVIATQSKSKSRSVPDIVKVVNGDVHNAQGKRRARNSSQCKRFDEIEMILNELEMNC